MPVSASTNKPKLSLSSIDAKTLKLAWNALKENYKDALVRDPLDLLAFEQNLDQNLKQLAYLVRSGRYLPGNTITLRVAKRAGLTRPFCILEISDSLLFKVIADSMADELHYGFSSQVAFGRSQQDTFGDGDSESWFIAWLNHQANLKKTLTQSGWHYVVKSDIGNFFASIDHKLLRQLVAERSGCSEDTINLLFFLLESFTWRPNYRENLFIGLPQENSDASRILAHAFLRSVDEEFQKEIGEGRYARWVDDVAIAVPSYEEGVSVTMRLQQALEKRNLAINTAKTVVISSTKFQDALYADWNVYLDAVMEATKVLTPAPPINLQDFEDKLRTFLSIPEEQRLSTWDRILRRFYTCARRIGSPLLEVYAYKHLQEFPASAKFITKYLLQRPFQETILSATVEYLKSQLNLYQDVEITLYDFLLAWCIPDQSRLRDDIANSVCDHLFARNGWGKPLSEYTKGLISLTIYKFGMPEHIDQLADLFFADVIHEPLFASYAVCTLIGTSHQPKALLVAEKINNSNMRRIHSFLSTVKSNPMRCDALLRKYARCDHYYLPTYYSFPARMLPLTSLVHSDSSYRQQWNQHLEQQVKLLEQDPTTPHDAVSLKRLRDLITRY